MNLNEDVKQTVIDKTAEKVQDEFYKFILEFYDESIIEDEVHLDKKRPNYLRQLEAMKESGITTLFVDFHHIMAWNSALAEQIEAEYYRFENYIRKSIQLAMEKEYPSYLAADDGVRVEKEFHVSIYGVAGIQKLRSLRSNLIGRLLSICATVTRTSEVRPELISGVFQCGECGMQSPTMIEQQFKYTEPTGCTEQSCLNRNKWVLNLTESKFVDWQKVRVQENSADIPSGSMPRSLEIILRHEMVEQVKAGDRAIFTGTLIVIPDISQYNSSGVNPKVVRKEGGGGGEGDGGGGGGGGGQFKMDGVKGMKDLGATRDLTYRLCFLANHVQPADSSMGGINIRSDNEENVIQQFTAEEIDEIYEMKEDKNVYQSLVKSIAPAVYGHEEIKKGILLMLFGGVHKTTPESINLRGDINVAVVGDPSTSKSQFLKYVVSFLPRAVYTSGKASSAAGLTATVVRDPDSGEFNIEAGALMLADNGICCIDEFDKMDVKDQVAIHEAMEQQTISIAKAGIQATFNARASILAAANPIGGRYDKSKTLKSNLNISAPIMSRFDLFFVVLDECDEESDYKIARHIVKVHQKKDEALNPPYSAAQLQRYIKFARCLDPQITVESKALLVDEYRKLRQLDAVAGGKTAYRITVRQLESLIRLSEALARIHCDDEVKPVYVLEAVRLLKTSIIHVESADVQLTSSNQNNKNKENEKNSKNNSKKNVNKKKTKDGEVIGFEDYAKILEVIVLFVKSKVDAAVAGKFKGISQQEIVNWYLKNHFRNDTEEQLIENQKKLNDVIHRLINVDDVLLEISPSSDPTKRLLTIHPNYK